MLDFGLHIAGYPVGLPCPAVAMEGPLDLGSFRRRKPETEKGEGGNRGAEDGADGFEENAAAYFRGGG